MLTREQCAMRRFPRLEDVRGPFLRDQTALIHSTPFRRLKHKAQVFFAPQNDHVCTRIEHVLHVATIAATICRGLNQKDWNLDTEIAYCGGLGHDIGHAPFGHAGERELDKLCSTGFQHESHSLRVADVLARDGAGLNLTRAVRDAIVCHNGERFEQVISIDDQNLDPEQKSGLKFYPATYEGCAVRFADKIAYLGRDLEDALLAGFLVTQDIPSEIRWHLGDNNRNIINTLVVDLIESSDHNGLALSDDKFKLFHQLYEFNIQRIYQHRDIKRYQDFCTSIIERLYMCFMDVLASPDDEKYTAEDYPVEWAFLRYNASMAALYEAENADPHRIITDYIAGMTDNYALSCMQSLTLPKPFEFR